MAGTAADFVMARALQYERLVIERWRFDARRLHGEGAAMANFRNAAVIGQWPELALIGTRPAATIKKPPQAAATRKATIVSAERFAVLRLWLLDDHQRSVRRATLRRRRQKSAIGRGSRRR